MPAEGVQQESVTPAGPSQSMNYNRHPPRGLIGLYVSWGGDHRMVVA